MTMFSYLTAALLTFGLMFAAISAVGADHTAPNAARLGVSSPQARQAAASVQHSGYVTFGFFGRRAVSVGR